MCVLPLGEPLVRVYPHHAFYQSILTLNPAACDWIYSGFIGLVNRTDYREEDCLYYEYLYLHAYEGCPFLDIHSLPRELLRSEENVKRLFREAIRAGYYIFLFLDEFDLPDRQFTGLCHLAHDNLLYGYEEGEDVFHTAYFDAGGKYRKGVLTGTQVRQAFLRSAESEFVETDMGTENPVRLIRGRENAGCRFDGEAVYAALRDFKASEAPPRQIPGCGVFHGDAPRKYGLDTLRTYCAYLEDMRQGSIRFDRRNPYFLAEYMRLMGKRLRYMRQAGQWDVPRKLLEDMAEAERLAEISMQLCFRFLLTQNGQSLARARGHVEEIVGIFEGLELG